MHVSCIHTYIHRYIHTDIHACLSTYMQTYLHGNIHAYAHACLAKYIHTYIHVYICAYIHIDAFMTTYKLIYMYTTYMYAFLPTYMETHACLVQTDTYPCLPTNIHVPAYIPVVPLKIYRISKFKYFHKFWVCSFPEFPYRN